MSTISSPLDPSRKRIVPLLPLDVWQIIFSHLPMNSLRAVLFLHASLVGLASDYYQRLKGIPDLNSWRFKSDLTIRNSRATFCLLSDGVLARYYSYSLSLCPPDCSLQKKLTLERARSLYAPFTAIHIHKLPSGNLLLRNERAFLFTVYDGRDGKLLSSARADDEDIRRTYLSVETDGTMDEAGNLFIAEVFRIRCYSTLPQSLGKLKLCFDLDNGNFVQCMCAAGGELAVVQCTMDGAVFVRIYDYSGGRIDPRLFREFHLPHLAPHTAVVCCAQDRAGRLFLSLSHRLVVCSSRGEVLQDVYCLPRMEHMFQTLSQIVVLDTSALLLDGRKVIRCTW